MGRHPHRRLVNSQIYFTHWTHRVGASDVTPSIRRCRTHEHACFTSNIRLSWPPVSVVHWRVGVRWSHSPLECGVSSRAISSREEIKARNYRSPWNNDTFNECYLVRLTTSWVNAELELVGSTCCAGSRTLRSQETSVPRHFGTTNLVPKFKTNHRWSCYVSHRNCPRSKWPGFSSITALVSKCFVPRYWCRSVLRPVPKCPRVSWCRSVR